MSTESKATIKVSRNILINTGNYSNCTTTVDLEISNVEPAKIYLVEKSMSNVLDSIQANELIKNLSEAVVVSSNPNSYLKELEKSIKEINEKGKNAVSLLVKTLEA